MTARDTDFTTKSIFAPEVLAKLGNFRLRVRKLASGMTFGEHTSFRTGISPEFQEHLPWECGQDPKFIDWRVYARTGRLFRRRYREEANAAFHFLIDYSGSMSYLGSREQNRLSKLEYARCTSAILAYVALRQRDMVSLTAFNGVSITSLRLSTGETHWAECLDFLDAPPFTGVSKEKKHTNFSEILNSFAENCTRPGNIVIFSDLFDVQAWNDILKQIKLLSARGNEILILHILDSDELDLELPGDVHFISNEHPKDQVQLSVEDIRANYLELVTRWRKEIVDGCRKQRIDYSLVDTTTPLHQTILSCFK